MAHSDPDLALVEATQAGDNHAFDVLMERHQDHVFRFICRYVANETDARELAQDAFVRAYQNISRFRPGALFSTWLFQITLNLCRDRLRSKAHRQASRTDSLSAGSEEPDTKGIPELPSPVADPASLAERRERMETVRQAIHELTDDLKAPFVLTVLEGLSHEDAGARLGLTAKAVEGRVHRARKSLANKLPRE